MQLVNEFVVPRPVDQTWAVLTDVERIAPAMPGAQLTDHVDDQYHGKVKVKVGPVTAQYSGIAQFKELDEATRHMVLEATGKESSGRGRASALVTADLTDEGGAQTRVKVITELTISGPLAQFGRGAIAEVSSRLLGQFVSNLEAMVLNDGAPATSTTAAAPAQPSATANSDTSAASPSSASPSVPSPSSPSPSVAPSPDGGASTAEATAASTAPAPSETPVAPGAAPEASAPAPSVPTQSRPQPAAQAAEVNLLQVAGWPILKRLIPVVVVIVVAIVLIVVFA
ncbi:MAG TPA: SRPBCC family protein [Micromonosporaceae bacterium]|jgi:hypothetical protein